MGRNTLIATMILFVVCGIFSCDKLNDVDDEYCGRSVTTEFSHTPQNRYEFFTGTFSPATTYYNYLSGPPPKVQFMAAGNFPAICTNIHIRLTFMIKMKNVPQTLPMKLYGDAYWSVFQDEVLMFSGIPTPGATYISSLEVGLKQAFPQGAGNIDAYVNAEFNKHANFSADSLYFADHVESMKVYSTYREF